MRKFYFSAVLVALLIAAAITTKSAVVDSVILRMQNGGSTLVTKAAGLLAINAGSGLSASLSGNTVTLASSIAFSFCSVTVGATPAIDATSCNAVVGNYNSFKLGPLAQNAAPTFAHGVAGQPYSIEVYQGAGTAYTVTWPANVIGGCPVDATLSNRTLLLGTMDSTGTNLLIASCAYPDATNTISSVSSGTFAAIPSCTSALTNRIYVFTDAIYNKALCNGTSWSYFVDGLTVTPPTATSWTNVNVNGSSSIETTHGSHWLNVATDNSAGYAYEYAAVGATFTKTFMIRREPNMMGSSANAFVVAAIVSDGTKIMTGVNYNLRQTTPAIAAPFWGLATFTNTAGTTGGANPAGADVMSDMPSTGNFCIQVVADVTNVTFSQAADCIHFTRIYQSVVSFFGSSISRVGFGIQTNSGVASHASLISYQ